MTVKKPEKNREKRRTTELLTQRYDAQMPIVSVEYVTSIPNDHLVGFYRSHYTQKYIYNPFVLSSEALA